MTPYKVEFSHAAQVKAVAQGLSLAALEERIRGELAEAMMPGGLLADLPGPEGDEDGPPDPRHIMMHVLGTEDDTSEEWRISGTDEGVRVHALEWERVEAKFPESHPFHGKTVMMPKVDD